MSNLVCLKADERALTRLDNWARPDLYMFNILSNEVTESSYILPPVLRDNNFHPV
jgi:hypothetical protein